jgi:hypothetical protein
MASVMNFAVPVDWSTVEQGQIILAERNDSWFVAMRITTTDPDRLVLLSQVAGKPNLLSLPETSSGVAFRCYAAPGSFLFRPTDPFSPLMDSDEVPRRCLDGGRGGESVLAPARGKRGWIHRFGSGQMG